MSLSCTEEEMSKELEGHPRLFIWGRGIGCFEVGIRR